MVLNVGVNLRGIARFVRKWLWLLMLNALLCGSIAYYLSVLAMPIYRASSTWLIDFESRWWGDLGETVALDT
ncbi:hypothetical protein KFU94_14395 [Chloroflexi bacterium TSY]|nr:hypothetical protein [Chloroflexi bacterium TSY]